MGKFLMFALVGFGAQLVDGCIGMAFGIIGSTMLLSVGLSPANASASLHAAEIFTTAVSGTSHWKFGNVDWRLVMRLALPGAVGGAMGAYILGSLPGESLRPLVDVYLASMGLWIVWRAFRRPRAVVEPPRWTPILGLGGGFLDAIGGGGWGPIVTTTLVGRGTTPRIAIGSVNLAEFFVTVTITGMFLFTIGLEFWPIIIALVVGGAIAAPIAAYAARHIPERAMMLLVGTIVVALSAYRLLV